MIGLLSPHIHTLYYILRYNHLYNKENIFKINRTQRRQVTEPKEFAMPDETDATSAGEQVREEQFRVTGEAVVATIKDLLREGNIRRITLKNEEGKVLFEIPLTVGVVGAILFPVWAAIGAVAALAANFIIVVEKVEPTVEKPAEE